jgi:sulfofructose kinase
MKRVLCVGHAVQDHVFRVPRLPTRAEKYRATGFSASGGGPAATAAVAIARLGGAARLAARVGDDAIADSIEAELRGFGVDCAGLRRCQGRHTSLSAVFVDEAGERMIVNHTDPAMPADPAWIDDLPLEDVDAVLVDTRWPEGAARALSRARAANLPAILDADLPVPRDGGLLRHATHVAFSEPGLRDYALNDDLPRALLEVARHTGAWCAVTLGGDGALVVDGRRAGRDVAGGDGAGSGMQDRIPAFTVQAVDTLGAGDVWHGAFALAIAEGAGEEAAVRAAAAAAAIKVSRAGGRAAIPTRAERDTWLEQR